jgi:hypothetical protein
MNIITVMKKPSASTVKNSLQLRPKAAHLQALVVVTNALS